MRTVTLDLTAGDQEIVITEDTQFVGLIVARDADVYTANLKFTHKAPGLNSRVNLKAVTYDTSRVDIQALVQIEPGAHHTDTYLKLDALVLSPRSFARAVPSMEIREDEVKGGHGATVGHLDQQMLHYLMARGISMERATETLVEAFISDIQTKIAHADETL